MNATQQKQAQGVSTQGRVMVFADVECLLNRTNTFVPMLICYAREDNDSIFHHWGPNCVQTFINTVLRWSNNNKEELHIFFHNLKGFDGIFMLDALYSLMGTGTKTLHFKHMSLVFKDCLSFLNMPLTNFTNTFGLQELKKGWFPHKFSKLENLQHEGPIPALRYYEPQHMDAKKKKACEYWHAEEVLKGEDWNLKKELLSYCESDVKLLKEGCLKFAEDTIRDAGFNSLLQCITIASTCHYFWLNFQIEPSTIAVEPPHGWGGLKTSQSKVAFQWLYYQDKQSGGNRIKHARNGCEQVIPVKRGKVKVDGYDPSTKTVYEFHGCEFHGCRKCKPNNRHVKTFQRCFKQQK